MIQRLDQETGNNYLFNVFSFFHVVHMNEREKEGQEWDREGMEERERKKGNEK